MQFRPRFSLRTLFVLVTLICAWLAYQRNWILQRHKLLEQLEQSAVVLESGGVKAPWSIRLFERGTYCIIVDPKIAHDPDRVKNLKSLFPETFILTPIDGKPVREDRQGEENLLTMFF